MPDCILMRERKNGYGLGWWGVRENLGGVREGKDKIRIFCKKKKPLGTELTIL